MPEIIDVIIHRTNGFAGGDFNQVFVVVDKMPNFVFERKGNCLTASDGGFYETYYYERPFGRFQAFCGRAFDIPLKDGTVEKAHGQWWDGKHQENAPEPIVSIGYSTIEQLQRCYVFVGGHISKAKFDKWMETNEPSTNYRKYEKRRKAEFADNP